jgi:DNA-binding HxlR family transcriptional regulator
MKKEKKKKRIKREVVAPAILQSAEADKAEDAPEADLLPYALAAVGGKWKMRILWVLRDGASMRYGEVKQQISSITDMMLSQSLRELTAAKLIVRQQYQQIPPKVEYRITPPGAELIPAVELLNAWAKKYYKGV